ncbi:hypothetical protein J6590_104978, partial [Homalodisca vitripennis]
STVYVYMYVKHHRIQRQASERKAITWPEAICLCWRIHEIALRLNAISEVKGVLLG